MILQVPILCVVAGALLIGLLIEVALKYREPWAFPAAFFYITTFAWYFVDLYITPENYSFLSEDLLNLSYGQVILFLLAYRLVVRWISGYLTRNASKVISQTRQVSTEFLLFCAIGLWVVLLAIGVMRMQGHFIAALFPIQARAGKTMWFRLAANDAGATGFLISTAAYLYVLVCATFGVLFFFLRSIVLRGVTAAIMVVAWPYFLLSGSRSMFLAVTIPFFFGYLFFGKQRLGVRVALLAVAFLIINSAMLVVVTYRGKGFEEYLSSSAFEIPEEDEELRQRGLNMIQELCFVNVYMSGAEPAWGARYVQEIANTIPRAIWPNKPMIRVDYAVFRGFAGGRSDIGVYATISTGMIGGGILNFGKWFGPIAPAILMAIWTGLLARWWLQRASVLRCLLFLFGLALTFNLGRDITLLTLWPIVFAYVMIRAFEWWRRAPAATQPLVGHRPAAAMPLSHSGSVVRW